MTFRVAILDMQPIDPPTGGGRVRLLGLYHALGCGAEAHYLGTYDWPGPRARRQKLSSSLEERLAPLSPDHFAAADARARDVGGRGVVDVTFPDLAALSPDFLAAARETARAADVIIFSHPWVWPLVCGDLSPDRQLIVYDAHNVEGLLRLALLDDGDGPGSKIVRQVVAWEAALARAAHIVLACSHEDRRDFIRFYGVPPERTRVAPNGAFTRAVTPASPAERTAARRRLGLTDRPTVLFVGSQYGPNVEAAQFIASTLAPALPGVGFAVLGGVGDALSGAPGNVIRPGVVTEADKRVWLGAADVAVNPMFGGSGTNIKMLEFMAAGLPIVSTSVGARGLEVCAAGFVTAEAPDFAQALVSLLADPSRAERTGAAGREAVERYFAWERISENLGALVDRRWRRLSRPRPYFSVVIPTFERPHLLTELIEDLARQTWRDFEVIVVDQSAEPWPDRDREFNVDISYVHTDLRGAVLARNRGADLATGRVLAFTDDDCRPCADWLAAAHAEFAGRDIVGLEGLITSDKGGQPDWRTVTNDGFEGIGFMTANLFVRADVFQRIDGFDVSFDNPHFREDTDLGWRMQSLGEAPFSRTAAVYHPPHRRVVERESIEARSAFFEKDALLLRKHPKKYVELLRRERQWTHNPHFWTHFARGLERYGVEPPPEVAALMPRRAAAGSLS